MGDELSPDEILDSEFDYVAQTAFQAHEDRARVTTFYLVTVGSLVAAILSAELGTLDQPFTYAAFASLFVVLSLMGLLTLLQLVRLREAWFESVLAMNQIKDYYVKHFQEEGLEDAFRWRTQTIPARFKRWSVAYMLALQVAVLGGASLGAAVIFVSLAYDQLWWQWAIVAAVGFVVLQMLLHRWLLRD